MGNNNQKGNKQPLAANPLEVLKDIGHATAGQMRQEASKLPQDFMDQLFGMRPPQRNYSGEIMAGEAIEMSEVFSGRHEEVIKQKQQVEFLIKLQEEEKVRLEKKTNELRIQIKTLQEEILVIAQKTQDLGEETKTAAMQSTVDPGEYHVIFFEKLLEFIRSFRKKIEQAATWLHAVNKRSSKRNRWGSNYAKYGAKYLLSGEHYLQRSAG